MIKYTYAPSPFYVANETYCRKIENELNHEGIHFRGRCDAWGFEILADFELNKVMYHLQCIKQQSTGGKNITEAKGLVYEGIEINGKSLDRWLDIQFQKNNLKRLFMSPAFKAVVPSPFYFRHNIRSDFNNQPLIDLCLQYQVDNFSIKNGKLKLLVHHPVEHPLELLFQLIRLSGVR